MAAGCLYHKDIYILRERASTSSDNLTVVPVTCSLNQSEVTMGENAQIS